MQNETKTNNDTALIRSQQEVGKAMQRYSIKGFALELGKLKGNF